MATGETTENEASNPLLLPWDTPFEAPPFDAIRPEHFKPAFDAALAAHRAEIEAIAANPEPPSLANTLDALELSGRLLDRVSGVFWNLAGADTNPALQAIERELSPVLARHASAIAMNHALFARIAALVAAGDDLALTPEQRRVLDLTHKLFVRAGAMLEGAARDRLAAIVERLATLGTRFRQNVLADEAAWRLELTSEEDRAGLPQWLLDSARRTGQELGLEGTPVIRLTRSSIEPFLQFSANRALREKAFAAWISVGEHEGPTDNRPIVTEILALRAERARLLGYPSFAAYKLDNTMAKTPAAVDELLKAVWEPAIAQAAREQADLQALAAREGENGTLGPHDWRFYTEKLRKARHDFDEAELKPYLQLDAMIAAAFHVAHRLFGLTFAERKDVPVYHHDVRAWEVMDAQGRPIALFYGDYFARPSKRSGAWMSSFRGQQALGGAVRPIVVNVMNFNKGAPGRPALLSLDDARTLFHEFGHGLHGIMSDVTYPSIAGTAVARDFVEFPSQLYEHWLLQPELLRRFAVHEATGEPIPQALVDKVLAARNFNLGFTTVEYTASALLDMAFHAREEAETIDPMQVETELLSRLGMPSAIAMRHRTPHFMHIFSGDGYSAGYYSYLWSEMLDADGFEAFEEVGDIFDPALADRLKRHVYAAGAARDPAEAYRAFRGRDPGIGALMRKRGFGGERSAAAGAPANP